MRGDYSQFNGSSCRLAEQQPAREEQSFNIAILFTFGASYAHILLTYRSEERGSWPSSEAVRAAVAFRSTICVTAGVSHPTFLL